MAPFIAPLYSINTQRKDIFSQSYLDFTSQRVLAHVDGNNFYCRCEQVFMPSLMNRPVIVLSNNDGCAISRTAEAKALGIKMGDPYFKIRDLCRKHKVTVFSSNYRLYGDMSQRMNEIYREFSPDVEVYSIDESFVDFTSFNRGDYAGYGAHMRAAVRRSTGIATCVGIGTTKTLAKLANKTAKNHPELNGVCDFTNPDIRERYLPPTSLEDLWGIGKASLGKLVQHGIRTAGQLRALDPKVARALLTVTGERMVLELNGIACLALETMPAQLQGTAVTRSFGRPVTSLHEMEEAVAAYAARAGEKLRRGGLAAVHGYVFMHTSKHGTDRWRHASKAVSFLEPTDCSLELGRVAVQAIRSVWASGFRYAKAGIVLTELCPISEVQPSLLTVLDREKSSRLSAALDAVNAKYGRHTLTPAAAGIRREWGTKFANRSRDYTTNWADVLQVSTL